MLGRYDIVFNSFYSRFSIVPSFNSEDDIMTPTLTQTIDLAIQITILFMLGFGYLLFRMKKYLWHAQLMMIGFFMILASFLLVMLPSLWMTYTTFVDPNTVIFDTSSIVHIPFGIMGLTLGAFLVIRWARNNFSLANMKATWLMRTATAVWAANVLIGAVIYFTMPS